MYRTIRLHPSAPQKVAPGQSCNGCGVCCAVAPCPLGAAVTLRTSGPCRALRWRDDEGRYVCGLIAEPGAHLPPALRRFAPWLARAAHRAVSAGSGCDCDWQPEAASTGGPGSAPPRTPG